MKPDMIKQDGAPVTQIEADQANEIIPQDYLSEKYVSIINIRPPSCPAVSQMQMVIGSLSILTKH